MLSQLSVASGEVMSDFYIEMREGVGLMSENLDVRTQYLAAYSKRESALNTSSNVGNCARSIVGMSNFRDSGLTLLSNLRVRSRCASFNGMSILLWLSISITNCCTKLCRKRTTLSSDQRRLPLVRTISSGLPSAVPVSTSLRVSIPASN